MKLHSSICSLLGAAALVSFGSNACAEEETPVWEGTPDAKSAIELTVSVNGTASLALPSNATTGYSWNLAEPLAEDSPVRVEFDTTGGNTKDKESGEPLCGAPGETLITFTGVHEGSASVTIVYIRPWEKGQAPVDSRTIHITVTK